MRVVGAGGEDETTTLHEGADGSCCVKPRPFRADPSAASRVRERLEHDTERPVPSRCATRCATPHFTATPPELAQAVAELIEREPTLQAANERLIAEVADVLADHLTRRGFPPGPADSLAGAVLGALRRAQRRAARGDGDPAELVRSVFGTLAPAFTHLENRSAAI